MIVIARKEIDIRPIIGAAVVFLILGSIIFGIYYFVIAKPAGEMLQTSKQSAMSQVSSLSSIGTSQAASDATTFSTRIQAAGSIVEVESILVEVNTAIDREQKRSELLDEVDTIVNGTFYSATGGTGKTQVQTLADLSQTLKVGINAKQTKAGLEAYEVEIDDRATSTWRTYLTSVVDQIAENLISLTRNSPPYGEFISKENALSYIASQGWETLRKLKFEEATVLVPVKDTFERTPAIRTGSTVKVYVYDTTADNLRLIFGNAVVEHVIYSEADISTIAWSLTDGATSQSYSVDMWETLKAAAAGDAEALTVGWSGYGSDLMDRALTSNIGSYTVSVIYVVKVSDTIGEEIVQYEFHESAMYDVILIPSV